LFCAAHFNYTKDNTPTVWHILRENKNPSGGGAPPLEKKGEKQ